MTLQNNDQFVVSRSNIPYSVDSENLVAQLEDSDLMVVCRSGIPYRATGEEIKASLSPTDSPPSLTSVTLAEDTPGGSRFDNQSFTSTLSWATKGVPEASLEMQATVTGTLDIAGTTDEIVGIDGDTFTLASDANLANGVFQAGDVVKQDNSPIVPVSSAITNVSSTTTPVYSDYATAVDGWYGSYTIEKAFNGINDPDGGALPNTGYPIVYAHPVNVVVEKIELKVYSTVNLTFPDGTVASVQGNSGEDVWYEGEIPGGSFTFTGSNSITIDEPGGSTYFDGIKLNGIELIDDQVIDVLTLQDASGLSDFEVGDVVTSGAPVTATISAIDIYGLYYEDESVSTSPLTSTDIAAEIGEQNYFNDDVNDANKNGNKGFYTYSDNTITIAYSGLTVGDSIGIVAGSPSGAVEGFDLLMSATGDVENSGIPFVGYEGSTLQGDKNSLPKTRSNVIVTASSGSFVLANETNGGATTSQFYIHWIEGLAEGVVKITAIDEATPSITKHHKTSSVYLLYRPLAPLWDHLHQTMH